MKSDAPPPPHSPSRLKWGLGLRGPGMWGLPSGGWGRGLMPAGAGLLLRSPAIQEESGSHMQCDWGSPGPNSPTQGPSHRLAVVTPRPVGLPPPLFSSLGVTLAMSVGMWGVTLQGKRGPWHPQHPDSPCRSARTPAPAPGAAPRLLPAGGPGSVCVQTVSQTTLRQQEIMSFLELPVHVCARDAHASPHVPCGQRMPAPRGPAAEGRLHTALSPERPENRPSWTAHLARTSSWEQWMLVEPLS